MERNNKRIISMTLILVLIAASIFSFTACNRDKEVSDETPQKMNIDIEKIAVDFVGDLVKGNFDDAYNNYSYEGKMKNAVNPDAYKELMEQLEAALGPFQKIIDTSNSAQEGYDIVSVTCEYEKDYRNINVVFDKDKKLAGYNITKPEGLSKEIHESKDEIPSNIEEIEVIVGEGKWKLPGTLSLPKGEGSFPAVVLVHGSGPSDRDETVGPNKPFRDIAWGLSTKGIAVLRYEKRTKEHQQEIIKMVNDLTVNEETIDDALIAVDLLREQEKIDSSKIYVIGHSLGGYLIPRIGVQDDDIAGFVIMAGPTRPLEDLIVEQIEYLSGLDGDISADEQSQIDALKVSQQKIKSTSLDENTSMSELMGINAKYWLDLRDYEPTEMAKELKQPMLILQGERDYQITMEDFENWKSALKDYDNVSFQSFEKLNHLFLSGEGQPNPSEYGIKGNIPQQVIDSISNWILNNK